MKEWDWSSWFVHEDDGVEQCDSISHISRQSCRLRKGHKNHGVIMHTSNHTDGWN